MWRPFEVVAIFLARFVHFYERFMTIKLYSYPACSTCRKAAKYLDANDLTYELKHIVDTPPSKNELQRMLKAQKGELKKLVNTSGMVYRELGLKDKLPKMSEDEVLTLLSKNGKLIKRPFLLSDRGDKVGFKEPEWKDLVS